MSHCLYCKADTDFSDFCSLGCKTQWELMDVWERMRWRRVNKVEDNICVAPLTDEEQAKKAERSSKAKAVKARRAKIRRKIKLEEPKCQLKYSHYCINPTELDERTEEAFLRDVYSKYDIKYITLLGGGHDRRRHEEDRILSVPEEIDEWDDREVLDKEMSYSMESDLDGDFIMEPEFYKTKKYNKPKTRTTLEEEALIILEREHALGY